MFGRYFIMRSLIKDRRGSSVLEFAIVSLPFLVMILGFAEICCDLFIQSALDSAIAQAARGIQVGTLNASGKTATNFTTASICPYIGILSCTNLIVGVEPIPAGSDFYSSPNVLTFTASSSKTGQVCTGTGGQLMVLKAWYLGPSIIGMLIPGFSQNYNGVTTHITTSSTGFVNEYFTGGQTGC